MVDNGGRDINWLALDWWLIFHAVIELRHGEAWQGTRVTASLNINRSMNFTSFGACPLIERFVIHGYSSIRGRGYY